ncbi:FKBP_C domain-containing protein [Cephalotus follicularis]|uniref:peptidylprolyl isomerase n=1 Tax=Cephalotus follicularis TaxID=3775 RepID=A0A1Q3DAG0_CEPFO|nr:FKBP_C domain-containing protein [Cephalotus follicularis]
MGFWGMEVKPGKPHPYHSDNVKGILHITQATLGLGSSAEKSILQCSVGHKSPIFLCTLLPNKIESCSLNLEFAEEDLVAFSVVGSRSIHLSGYFVADDGDYLRDEYESDSFGEDIAETETDESSEYDTEDNYDDDFIDDDDDYGHMFSPSPIRNSGVVIEEITEDGNPATENNQSKRQKEKNQSSDSEDKINSQKQIALKSNSDVTVYESEDEDGFPTSASHKSEAVLQDPNTEVDEVTDNRTSKETKKKKKVKEDSAPTTSKKRKVKNTDENGQLERKKNKKLKGKDKEKKVSADGNDNEVNGLSEDEHQAEEMKGIHLNQASTVGNECGQKQSIVKGLDINAEDVPSENGSEKNKKKKKKKTPERDEVKQANQTVSGAKDEKKSNLKSEKQTAVKSSQVRTYPNGLVIEEVAMGRPDGKRASPGNQVSVRYIGKLKKNGKIFDSNVGRAPFKFRLGVGQVIKGWDVGVNGMRVGDKRRLTIPPSMGYGGEGAGGKIPPNAWLEFDVELISVG